MKIPFTKAYFQGVELLVLGRVTEVKFETHLWRFPTWTVFGSSKNYNFGHHLQLWNNHFLLHFKVINLIYQLQKDCIYVV